MPLVCDEADRLGVEDFATHHVSLSEAPHSLLACVMGGVYTDVEKTMIEIQGTTNVQQTRNAFQNAMQDKFINAVQHLTGRSVLTFIPSHHVGPDIELELFLLTPDQTS